METEKFEVGMIYNDNILIIHVSVGLVEYFDFKEAKKYTVKNDVLFSLLKDCKPVSCKDVFFQKLQMDDMD